MLVQSRLAVGKCLSSIVYGRQCFRFPFAVGYFYAISLKKKSGLTVENSDTDEKYPVYMMGFFPSWT
jgi:hypothetical protein